MVELGGLFVLSERPALCSKHEHRKKIGWFSPKEISGLGIFKAFKAINQRQVFMKKETDTIVPYLNHWWQAVALCLFSVQVFCLLNSSLTWAETTKALRAASINKTRQCAEPEEHPGLRRLQLRRQSEGALAKRALGMAVRVATREEARRFHVSLKQPLVINWLDPTGPLAYAGVEVNDVLLEIDGQPLGGFEDLMHIACQLKSRQRVIIVILDHRTGRKGYIQVQTP